MQLGAFSVPGRPVPKQRARTVEGRDGRKHTFTPPRTAVFEELIGKSWRGPRRFGGAVKVTLQVIEGKGQRKGDLDNYLKSVLDGLNGVAFVDDKQVVAVAASIIRGDDRPGIHVIVEGWE